LIVENGFLSVRFAVDSEVEPEVVFDVVIRIQAYVVQIELVVDGEKGESFGQLQQLSLYLLRQLVGVVLQI
jgi:hypothetical protein